MTKLGLAVINISDTGICLDQFRQITYVPYEAQRKLGCRPDAPIPFDFKLLVEIV